MLRRLPKIITNLLIIFNTIDLPQSFIKIIQNRFTIMKSDYVSRRYCWYILNKMYKNVFQLLKIL